MAYDIYKLSTEVGSIATRRAGEEIREIANQLEIALNSFVSGSSTSTYRLDSADAKDNSLFEQNDNNLPFKGNEAPSVNGDDV